MKAIVGAAALGLAFGAQDDELWSLFPKADPIVVSEPTLIIENNQNSGMNAVKMNQNTYTGFSLFKKPATLTLDDDNELWSLFPKPEPQPILQPTPIIENNQNSGMNAVKMNQNTYTGFSLFKKPATLTLDDDNELWSLFRKVDPTTVPEPTPIIENNQNLGTNAVKMNQNTYTGFSLFKKPATVTLDDNDDELFARSKASDSELEIRFLGNLNKFIGRVFQQPKKTIMTQHADDELVNLDFLINDALQIYNDMRQPKDKRDYGKIVNDAIKLVKDQKKHDDEDNELNLLGGVFNKKASAFRDFLGRDDEN